MKCSARIFVASQKRIKSDCASHAALFRMKPRPLFFLNWCNFVLVELQMEDGSVCEPSSYILMSLNLIPWDDMQLITFSRVSILLKKGI